VLDILKSQVNFKLYILVKKALIISNIYFKNKRGSYYYKVPKKSFKYIIYNI
jgi:hypothetical protein